MCHRFKYYWQPTKLGLIYNLYYCLKDHLAGCSYGLDSHLTGAIA